MIILSIIKALCELLVLASFLYCVVVWLIALLT